MTTELTLGYYSRKEWLTLLGIANADDPKLAAIAALSWGGNALKVLRVNATENGWELAAVSAAEPPIAAGTAAQYWRGDKSWQTLNGLAVANTPAGNIAAATVQAALNELDTEKQATHANLTAFSGLSLIADRVPYGNGAGTLALAIFTAAGRALVDDADAAAQRTTLGLVIGTDVQAQDAQLAAVAGLTPAADQVIYWTGATTAAMTSLTTFGRSLIDDADAAAGRTTLGLSTAAAAATGASGHTLGFLDAANTYSALQTFSSGIDVGTINQASGVALQFNGANKIVTVTGGVNVTGNVAATSNIFIADGARGYWVDTVGSFTYGIAKSASGAAADLQFYSNAIKMTLSSAGHLAPNGASQTMGTAAKPWLHGIFSGYVKVGSGTVAALVAAATAGAGARAFVTDANSLVFGAAAVGGGANKAPVWCDGAGWFIG